MKLDVALVDHGHVDASEFKQLFVDSDGEISELENRTRGLIAHGRPGRSVMMQFFAPAILQELPSLLGQHLNRTRTFETLRFEKPDLFQCFEQEILPKISAAYPDTDMVNLQVTELPAGAEIKRHVDTNMLSIMHRLHIPLITNPNVVFIVEGEEFFLEENRLYELNNVVPHSVENRSDQDRWHLMIDMVPHKFARANVHHDEQSYLAALGVPARA